MSDRTMTNEEAAAILESEAEFLYAQDEPYNRQAFKMAIEALRHQDITQAVIKVDFSEEDKKQLVEEIVEKLKYGKAVCIPNEYAQNATEAAETPEFHEGELIVYQNGETFQIGEIKRICDDGAFVWYHEGDTASKTPFENMHKLRNAYCIKQTSFALDRQRCGSCRHFSECSAMTDIETTTDASNCSEYEMIIRRAEP